MFLLTRSHTQYPEYMEFVTLAEAKEWGLSNFGDWLPQYHSCVIPHFDDEDVAAKELFMYLGYGYRAINNELRDSYYLQHMDTSADSRALRRLAAQHICSLIFERTIENNIILYRIVNNIEIVKTMVIGNYKNLKKGTLLMDKGFMSTSLVYETLKAEYGGTILLRLLCPKGYHGAYVELLSKRPNEQEVLLPPNSIFSVITVYKNKDKKVVIECLLQPNEI